MASNERFVRDLFNDIAADGFEKEFEDALHEDLVWVATGSSPVSGESKGKQVYLEKIIRRLHDRLQSWPKAVVENILVDGDVACVQFHGEGGIGKNGANFDMQYCWVMKVRNQKIVHVTGYYDSVNSRPTFPATGFCSHRFPPCVPHARELFWATQRVQLLN